MTHPFKIRAPLGMAAMIGLVAGGIGPALAASAADEPSLASVTAPSPRIPAELTDYEGVRGFDIKISGLYAFPLHQAHDYAFGGILELGYVTFNVNRTYFSADVFGIYASFHGKDTVFNIFGEPLDTGAELFAGGAVVRIGHWAHPDWFVGLIAGAGWAVAYTSDLGEIGLSEQESGALFRFGGFVQFRASPIAHIELTAEYIRALFNEPLRDEPYHALMVTLGITLLAPSGPGTSGAR